MDAIGVRLFDHFPRISPIAALDSLTVKRLVVPTEVDQPEYSTSCQRALTTSGE